MVPPMTTYLSVREAAAVAGVSTRTIHRWLANETLTRYKQKGDSGVDENRIEAAELGELVRERAKIVKAD